MVYCGECGKRNSDGAGRCIYCGALLQGPIPVEETREVPPREPPARTEPWQQQRTRDRPRASRNPKINLGRSAVTGLVSPGSVALGIIMIIAGGALILYRESGILESMPSGTAIALIMGVLLILAGIGAIIGAFSKTMETIYLKDGYCQVVNARCGCRGGCNKCVFAQRYVELNNPDDREE